MVVLPSVREQFGQVLVEGMACGLPAIAVDAWGPAGIVGHGETGWLVEPDDELGLANALVHAVNCPTERRRAAGRGGARERYSWPALAREWRVTPWPRQLAAADVRGADLRRRVLRARSGVLTRRLRNDRRTHALDSQPAQRFATHATKLRRTRQPTR